MDKIKVLIADDSPFIRQLFLDFFQNDPSFQVIGKARNGQQVLDFIEKQKPDVITLDHQMPVMSGLEALKIIMEKNPLPVIMVSGHTHKGTQLTLDALELGAFDFVTKPEVKNPQQLYNIRDELLKKAKAAARQFRPKPKPEPEAVQVTSSLLPSWQPFTTRPKLIIIGTSSGGPRALQQIIPAFSLPESTSMIIVQHMPGGFTTSLAQRLDKDASFPVREAHNGDGIVPGRALVAPGDFHLIVDDDHSVILNKKPHLWGVRPAVDHTLKSAASIYKENLIGIILTGMGRDGSEGMVEVKKYGGRTLVEDETTCTVFGMPRAVIQAAAADVVLPLPEIPLFIAQMFEEEKIREG